MAEINTDLDYEGGARIGTISNYYGGLYVRQHEGRHQWCIENYDGLEWRDIPEDLYQVLMAYEMGRQTPDG